MSRTLSIPTLATERLTLEPLGLVHSAGMFAMWASPEVCRYSGPAFDLSGRPIRLPAEARGDSDTIIAFFLRGAATGQRFRWAIRRRTDGSFVGAVGFNTLGACSEIAYHLHPGFWGAGLMTEAAGAALHWLNQQPGAVEVEAFVAPENTPSIRLAERLGMHPTGETSDSARRYRKGLPR